VCDRERAFVSESDYSGSAWSGGPQRVYDRLADRAVALLPNDIAGRRALDAGAGTGAMTRALLARGADVDATDASADMLEELTQQVDRTVETTVADICSLPMADDSYDVATAGFVLNHLHDPAAALRELARVTRTGGSMVATTFVEGDPPVKLAIDAVLTRNGWQPPEWYAEAKERTMPLTATVPAFSSVADAAGLGTFDVHELTVDFSDLDADAVAAYRLGMAHTAPFVASLPDSQQAELTAQCVTAVAAAPSLTLPMLVLLATV
jgi:SAM-dependent methyltransferase